MSTNGAVTGWGSAAKICGRSVASLRRMVEGGQLRSERDAEGRHLFARQDLEELRQVVDQDETETVKEARAQAVPAPHPRGPRLDALEVAIFTDLDRGRSPSEIAVSYGVDPVWLAARVRAWHRLSVGDQRLGEKVEQLESTMCEIEDRLDDLAYSLNSLRKEMIFAIKVAFAPRA